MGYIFSLGTLALVGDRAGIRGARDRAKCELGILLGSVVVTAILELWLGPEGLGFTFSLVCVSLSEAVLGPEGLEPHYCAGSAPSLVYVHTGNGSLHPS